MRLGYVARLTGEAAEKVLDRVDRARAEQDALASAAHDAAAELKRDPRRALASGRVLNMLESTSDSAARTNALLTEIMLAQDFHDLTSQVIGRLVEIAQDLEAQLLQLLVDSAPVAQLAQAQPTGLGGPAVDAARRDDVVTSQGQVDDLLESLGF
jgi:chemotaxis protein CheZ